jgi:hypothetical protein
LHRHTAELREVEEIQADRIEAFGLSLKPTYYNEEDEVLEREIQAERDDPYFDVRRAGVSDEPIRMRFGRCLWEKTLEGRAHLIHLVSERGDTEERQRGGPRQWFSPELGRIGQKAFVAAEGVEALLDELVTSGVLSPSAADTIRARAEAAPRERARELDEANDLNDHV